MEKYFVIGQITRPHGIKGEVKVNPMTDDINRFSELDFCFTGERGSYKKWDVESANVNVNQIIISLSGVKTRSEAELMRGKYLYVDREHAIQLPEGRYFISDLIGLKVYSDKDVLLGKIIDVTQPGASDVYEVENDDRSFLMPALKSLILSVDIAAGVMTVSDSRLREVTLYED